MEPVSDLVGYPLTLLIERIFWLGLGGFFGLALITSVIRTIKEKNNKGNMVSAKDLEMLANNAVKENKEDD